TSPAEEAGTLLQRLDREAILPLARLPVRPRLHLQPSLGFRPAPRSAAPLRPQEQTSADAERSAYEYRSGGGARGGSCDPVSVHLRKLNRTTSPINCWRAKTAAFAEGFRRV